MRTEQKWHNHPKFEEMRKRGSYFLPLTIGGLLVTMIGSIVMDKYIYSVSGPCITIIGLSMIVAGTWCVLTAVMFAFKHERKEFMEEYKKFKDDQGQDL